MQGRFAKQISELKGFIESHTKEAEDLPFLCQLESRLQCFHLQNKLESILSSNDVREADLIKLCESFLKERWSLVSDTQAVYFRSQRSVVNKACVKLSTILADVSSKAAYEYLMPTVNSSHYDIMKINKRIKLEDMVLGDKDEIIFVQKCLQNFESDRRLRHTYAANAPLLSSNEKLRVIHHSREAKEYYDAFRLGNGGQLAAKRKALLILLASKKTYFDYDSRGYQDEKLAEFVLSQLNSPFDLARYMHANVHRDGYQQFLSDFFKKEHCADFINLQGASFPLFKKTLDKQLANIQDELLIDGLQPSDKECLFQALSIVILHCCRYIRSQGDDFHYPGSSFLNSFSSYYSGSYSKQQKVDAISAFIGFFSSGEAQMIAVPTFLNQSSVIKPHIAALKSGQLEWFINKIEGFSAYFLDEALHLSDKPRV